MLVLTPYSGSLARYFAQLATVDLSDCEVDDTNLPQVWFVPNLKSLRLANTKVTAGTIKALHGCRQLESLDLSGTPIVDHDLATLSRLRRLRCLLLNDTAISDAAVGHLSKCRGLKRLELTGTRLSEHGYREGSPGGG